MGHDNSAECPEEGFVMSEKRSLPKWSQCNAATAQKLFQKECLFNTPPQGRYHLKNKYPGKYWTILNQCRTQLG